MLKKQIFNRKYKWDQCNFWHLEVFQWVYLFLVCAVVEDMAVLCNRSRLGRPAYILQRHGSVKHHTWFRSCGRVLNHLRYKRQATLNLIGAYTSA